MVTMILGDKRVVEYSELEGVQYAGRLLAALGADVIKLENLTGDAGRRKPPFAPGTDGSLISIPFDFLNSGKRSASIDLDSAAGRRTAQALLAGADIVLGDRRLADLTDLARQANPEQIRVVADIFGAATPAETPETAFTRFHASTSGYLVPADKDTRSRPAASMPTIFEAMHGVSIGIAVLAQLFEGAGGDVDYSYQSYGVWLDKMNFHQVSVGGEELHRYSHAYPFGGNMACRDGYVCLFVIEEHQWRNLCGLIGRSEWVGDPRFADGILRRANQQVIDDELKVWCAARTAEDVLRGARDADVPVGLVRTPTKVLKWDTLMERGFLREDDTGFGRHVLPQLPFGDGLSAVRLGRAPQLGENTLEIIESSVRDEALRGDVLRGEHDVTEVRTATPAPSAKTEQRPQAANSGPLSGVRVLDFTWAAAGPVATSIMAYLGADVVKVEHRSRPDLMRVAARQYGFGGNIDIDASPGFNEMAAGKRSIELDLRDPADLEIALRLAGEADIVMENMRPGKFESLGLSYAAISERNPGVVMCSQSALGRVGKAGVPGYAPIFWSEGGGAWLTGWQDKTPGVIRGPIDNHAAAYALVGILALLRKRQLTGAGGFIDCSATESVTALIGAELLEAQITGSDPGRRGNAWPGYVFNDVLPCRGEDQWIAVSVRNERDWRALRDELEIDQTTVDAVLDEAGGGERGRERLWQLLAERTAQRDAAALEKSLCERGVPAARSLSLVAARKDPRIANRGTWQTINHPLIGEQAIIGIPWTVSGRTFDMDSPAPLMGQHKDEIMNEWLGTVGSSSEQAG